MLQEGPPARMCVLVVIIMKLSMCGVSTLVCLLLGSITTFTCMQCIDALYVTHRRVINSACLGLHVTILLTCYLKCVFHCILFVCCFLFFSFFVSVFLSILYFVYDSIINK